MTTMATSKPTRDTYEVVMDAPELGPQRRIGWLHRSTRRRDVPAAFEYDAQWLGKDAFLLDPRLGLWGGEQHPPSGAAAFGIFMDSAPDRWGRVLLEQREAIAARREDRPRLQLFEMDFLLGVNDLTRIGGLRFRHGPDTPFLDHGRLAAPPVTSLRELAAVSRRIEDPDAEELPEYEAWLAMLVAPGTALGGARPKANFTENDGSLWIAKFPSREDRYDVGAWEFLLHHLADKARIDVPEARLERLTERYSTFLVQRFDRTAVGRRMYSSAMTLLEHRDGDNASYLELAEFIENNGAQGRVKADLAQLYRRVVFNVMAGNRDDHLRNHGFIRVPTGWQIAPAFDMNPNPAKGTHELTLDGATTEPSLDVVLGTADFYRVTPHETEAIVAEVRNALSDWPRLAGDLGLSRSEVQRMATVLPTNP